MSKRVVSFISPTGYQLDFTVASGVALAPNFQVGGMPNVSIGTQPTPGRAGAVVNQVQYGMRTVQVPVTLMAPGGIGAGGFWLELMADTLAVNLDPTAGDGLLQVQRHGATIRVLPCRYLSGLQITEPQSTDEVKSWGPIVLTFQAAQPFWLDATPNVITIAAPTASSHAFFPFPPLVLSSSGSVVGGTVYNSGHVPTFPVWTIRNQAVNPKITNVTTGQTMTLNASIADGASITIDTDQGTIVTSAGVNLLPYLSSDSELFPLAVGANDFAVDFNNPSGTTAVDLSYRNRYLTA